MLITIYLFVLGLCFGSFLNAMVWRIHKGMDWVKDRSQCDHCGHKLAPKDLVPLFSWLFLRGKCRYCRKKLSWQHPAIELLTGVAFAASYAFWPGDLAQAGEIFLLASWLVVLVGLLALFVYDMRWMILPNKIVYPVAAVAAAARLAYIVFFAADKPHALLQWLLSVIIASGIFYLLYLVSKGKWIGFGDVRLGLITGTVLADPFKSFLMIFVASVLGTLFVAPSIVSKKSTITTRIPFGPFLIIATIICLLFGDSLVQWYKNLILP